MNTRLKPYQKIHSQSFSGIYQQPVSLRYSKLDRGHEHGWMIDPIGVYH